jgi:hypothetical protein
MTLGVRVGVTTWGLAQSSMKPMVLGRLMRFTELHCPRSANSLVYFVCSAPSIQPFISGCSVLARGDALNLYSILSKGGSAKEHSQSICLDFFAFCSERRIELRPEWLPREENARADYLSKV